MVSTRSPARSSPSSLRRIEAASRQNAALRAVEAAGGRISEQQRAVPSISREDALMMEALQQRDGRYVVRDLGGIALDVVGMFDSKREAREWLADHSLDSEASHSGLDVMKPGDEEGRR